MAKKRRTLHANLFYFCPPPSLNAEYAPDQIPLNPCIGDPDFFREIIIYRSCFLSWDLQPLPLPKLHKIQELLLIIGSATPSSSITSWYSGVASYHGICNPFLFRNFIKFRSYFLLLDLQPLPLPKLYNIQKLLLINGSATPSSSKTL